MFAIFFTFSTHSIYFRATPLSFQAPSPVACAIIHFLTKKLRIMGTIKHEIEQINRVTVSDVKLIYYPKIKPSERPYIQRSGDAHTVFMEKWDSNNIHLIEEFKLMLLNRGNRVLGVVAVSSGGMTGTVADPRIILRYALLAGATSIVLAHNHPSGNLKPSHADEALTQKIRGACQYVDISVMDHIIINGEGYYSMADEGLI
jgi:DNA repair protein RadC